MRVKPAPGLSVRNPETKQLLPAEGIDVPDDSILWTKMINDGDVVAADTRTGSFSDSKASAKEGDKA